MQREVELDKRGTSVLLCHLETEFGSGWVSAVQQELGICQLVCSEVHEGPAESQGFLPLGVCKIAVLGEKQA